MTSELHQLQFRFARNVAKLIRTAFKLGYKVTLGDCYRDKRCPYGNENSLHHDRLAIDLNLFKKVNDKWVYQETTEAHEVLGMYWESLHELNRWGGHFGDGNHYSMTYQGRK